VYGLELLTGDPSKHPRASKSHGSSLIPDCIKDKGDRIELLTKVQHISQLVRRSVLTFLQLPPHIRTVHRSTDATQTELIAKYVDKQSIELEALEYLRTIRPHSSCIIFLIDAVPTDTGKWLIFPKMCTADNYPFIFPDDPRLGGRIALFGCDLIEGLAYLHIDFNTAIRAGSEDDVVECLYGTRGWMALKIQEQSAFSHIRADRWSCGINASPFSQEKWYREWGSWEICQAVDERQSTPSATVS
jgi:hypothetical protein